MIPKSFGIVSSAVSASLLSFLAQSAQGQVFSDSSAQPLPKISIVDENHVDLWANQIAWPMASLSLGGENDGPKLEINNTWAVSGPSHNYMCYTIKWRSLRGGHGTGRDIGWKVICNNKTTSFRENTDGTFQNSAPNGDGEVLEVDASAGFYTVGIVQYPNGLIYTNKEGSKIKFYTSQHIFDDYGPYSTKYWGYNGNYSTTAIYFADKMIYPTGEVVSFYYNKYVRTYNNGTGTINNVAEWILQSVNSNYGLQLKFNYTAAWPQMQNWSGYAPFFFDYTVTAINNSIEYCDPLAEVCNLMVPWPKISYSVNKTNLPSGVWAQFIEEDSIGNKTIYNLSPAPYADLSWPLRPNLLTSIVSPGGSNNVTISYGPRDEIISVNRNGVVSNYSWQNTPNWVIAMSSSSPTAESTTQKVTVTNQLGESMQYYTSGSTVASGLGQEYITSVVDSLGNVTAYTMGCGGIPESVTHPEGDRIQLVFDSRCNVIQQSKFPKGNSGQAPLVTLFGYDSVCTNPVTCNKPNWARDALGNETDYTYDASYGVLTSITKPASASGVRPQTRYKYGLAQAYFFNSSGGIVASGQSVYVPTGASECQAMAGAPISGVVGQGPFSLTGPASCEGSADEAKTSIGIGPQTNGIGNNLFPAMTSTGSGDNILSETSYFSYDLVGNIVVQTDAKGNNRYDTYDALRRKIFEISPDPDGPGALPRQIVRHTYDIDGHETRVETGYGFNTNGSDFVAVMSRNMTYDQSTGQLVRTEVVQP